MTAHESPRTLRWFIPADLIAYALVVVYALWLFWFAWQGQTPHITATGDIANIISPLVAEENPERFAHDLMLADLEVLQFYRVVLNDLIRVVNSFVDDIGLVVLLIGIPVTIVYGISHYLLGLFATSSRFWAWMFFLPMTFTDTTFVLGEIWGTGVYPLPRTMFAALLPLVLVAAFRWRSRPGRWVYLMIAVGLLVYVHPVSTPAWGFALWLGLWLFQPVDWSIVKRLTVMFGLGMVFLLTITPFAINYLTSYESGVVFDEGTVLQITTERYARGYYELDYALRRFTVESLTRYFTPLFFAGSILLYVRGTPQRKEQVRLIWVWAAGLLIVSVGLMWLDHAIARRLERLPYQVDLIRGIRYLIPLGALLAVWLGQFVRSEIRNLSVRVIASMPVFAILLFAPIVRGIEPGLLTLIHNGQPQNTDESLYELVTYMDTLDRDTSTILFANAAERLEVPLALRYSYGFPLVYTFKDGGMLAYGDVNRLLIWNNLRQTLGYLDALDDNPTILVEQNHLMQQVSADYLLFMGPGIPRAEPVINRAGFELAFSNARYVLLHKVTDMPYTQVHLNVYDEARAFDVYCLPGEMQLQLADANGNSIRVDYAAIQAAMQPGEPYPVQIMDEGEYSLWAMNEVVLRAQRGEEIEVFFTLYRCN